MINFLHGKLVEALPQKPIEPERLFFHEAQLHFEVRNRVRREEHRKVACGPDANLRQFADRGRESRFGEKRATMRVTARDGLATSGVGAIAQTPDGVMWFATDGGLARYDGQRTQAITAEGLPPGRVLALKLDQDGSTVAPAAIIDAEAVPVAK